jgi:hypothetical protein
LAAFVLRDISLPRAARWPRARGTDVTGPQTHGDAAIEEENRTIDRKVNSICRGG